MVQTCCSKSAFEHPGTISWHSNQDFQLLIRSWLHIVMKGRDHMPNTRFRGLGVWAYLPGSTREPKGPTEVCRVTKAPRRCRELTVSQASEMQGSVKPGLSMWASGSLLLLHLEGG